MSRTSASEAASICASLRATAEDYHAGRIDHAALRERNGLDWRAADAMGVSRDVRDMLAGHTKEVT